MLARYNELVGAGTEHPFVVALAKRLRDEIGAPVVAVIDGGRHFWGLAGDDALLADAKLVEALWLRAAVAVKQSPLRGLGTIERVPVGAGRVALLGLAWRRLILIALVDEQRAEELASPVERRLGELEWWISDQLVQGRLGGAPPVRGGGHGGSAPGSAELQVVEAGVTKKLPS